MPETSSSSLTGLPVELFENVTESLDSADLKSLRLVSRESADKVYRPYACKVFHTMSMFQHDEQSLRMVKEAVDHPAFGPCVRKVIIFVDVLAANPLLPRNMELDQAIEKQKMFRDLNISLELMTNIFATLSTLNNLQKVHVTETAHEPSQLCGFRDLAKFEGSCFRADPPISGTDLLAVFKALYQSDAKPTAFIYDVSYASANVGVLLRKECIEVLNNLEHLDLNVSVSRSGNDRMMTMVVMGIAKAPKLKQLSLKIEGAFVEHLLRHRMPALESLHITTPGLTLDVLIEFVQQNPGLKKLDLRRVLIWDRLSNPLATSQQHAEELVKSLRVEVTLSDVEFWTH